MRSISICCCALLLLSNLALPAPLKELPLPAPTDEQYEKSINNLKELGLGVHNYHDAVGKMPANVLQKKKPALSWRVHLLPYMEEDALYREFHLDEPWDSDHNKKLIEKIPKIYQPVRGRFKPGETFYQMFNWEHGILRPDSSPITLAGIPDGTSNTLLIVEAGKPVIWTKPDDIAYDGGKTLPKLGGMFDGNYNAVLADGSAVRIPKGLDDETLRRIIDPRDGLVVNLHEILEKAKEK